MLNYKRFVLIMLTFAMMFTTVLYSLNSKQVSAGNIINRDSKVKVFVGGALPINTEEKEDYIKQRMAYLKDEKSEDICTGTVVFDSFLQIEDLNRITNENINVKKIWFSVPGVTGRHMTTVSNNDISQAIKKFINEISMDTEKDEGLKLQHEEIIKGNYGIFSITAEGKLNDLKKFTNNDSIKLIDLHYNAYAENIANRDNKQIVYIELSEKPDGTE